MRVLVLRGLHEHGAMRRAVVVAMLVGLPSLGMGIFADDYIHLATLRGIDLAPAAHWYNVFVLTTDGPTATGDEFVRGSLPWFTAPDFRVRFFRVLSSVTMMLDWQLFGAHYWLYHLHSLVWYALLVWAAGRVLRRELTAPTAALALLLFAVDEAHVVPVAWWSNRNALVAVVPAVLGLHAHLRWREDGWRPGLPLSLLGYALGLGGGETALGIAGYVLAYEVFGSRDAWPRRFRALVPSGLVFVGYLAFYKLAAFGVRDSAIYIDPVESPGDFLRVAPARWLALVANQMISAPPEATIIRTWMVPVFAALGLAVLAGGFVFFQRMRGDIADRDWRAVRWLVAGAAISTAPVLSTFASSRLLTLASLGGAAPVAIVLRLWAERIHPTATWRGRAAGAIYAFVMLLVPLVPWIQGPRAIAAFNMEVERAAADIDLDDADVARQRVVIVAAADPSLTIYALPMRVLGGHPRPRAWQLLSGVPSRQRVTRVGTSALEMVPLDHPMLTTLFELLLCRGPASWPQGSRSNLGWMQSEILEGDDAGVRRVRFTFEKPLDDPSYVFLAFRDGRLTRFVLPAMGESIEVSSLGGPLGHLFTERPAPPRDGE